VIDGGPRVDGDTVELVSDFSEKFLHCGYLILSLFFVLLVADSVSHGDTRLCLSGGLHETVESVLYSCEKRGSCVGVGGMDDVYVLEIAVFVLPPVARHRDERAVLSVDQLDSVNRDRVVKGDVRDRLHVACGKGLGDLCVDFHGLPPSCDYMKKEPDLFSDSRFLML
jgi:hypothetical protein